MTDHVRTRLATARQAAADLLEELETTDAPVAQSLMRAKRLARLLRDEDAQRWLDLELGGYPSGFHSGSLGTCQRYAISGGRVTADGKYYLKSLPGIEADCRAQEQSLQATPKLPQAGAPKDFVAANATLHFLQQAQRSANVLRTAYTTSHALYVAMRAAIHAYATDCSIALELGDSAEEIFDAARRDVDSFIRSRCPNAANQLLAISERIREDDAEAFSAALTSCRRLLAAIADVLYPPNSEPYVDASGTRRKVGPDEYKNRLLAFMEASKLSGGTKDLLTADLDHLAARLDAVYEKACKGVHAEVSPAEARLAVIHTYLFIAEIARMAPSV